jgi:phosphonate transport system permease protein
MQFNYFIFQRFSKKISTQHWILFFLGLAFVGLYFADFVIANSDPWVEVKRIFWAAYTPDFTATENLFDALLNTLAFALYAILISIILGFILSFFYSWVIIRLLCAYIRGVHELFWALIFITVFGISPLAGLVAIALPYTGIFARVFAELMEQIDPLPEEVMREKSRVWERFIFSRIPQAISLFRSYSKYRLECALRSSAILGFVGLPTLGYYLDTAFREGNYSEAWALLYLFFVLVATKFIWLRLWILLPIYLFSFWHINWLENAVNGNLWQFISFDIIPSPIRGQELQAALFSSELWDWVDFLWNEQAFPGIVASLNLTLLATWLTALIALLTFPIRTRLFVPHYPLFVFTSWIMIMMRSVPELILAFVFVLFLGPSMLPAVFALALHNGGIIAYLLSAQVDKMKLRDDRPKGLDLYFYKILPRIFHSLLVFIFYRAEVILRETAILGILGIATLGFYIDSAFEDLRYDRALFLINITALLNIVFEMIARRIRTSMEAAHAYEKH